MQLFYDFFPLFFIALTINDYVSCDFILKEYRALTILRVFSYSSEKNGRWKWCCTRQPKVVLQPHENLNSNKLPCHGNLPHHLDNTLARLVFPVPFHPNLCNQHCLNPSHDVLDSNITSWKADITALSQIHSLPSFLAICS